MAFANKIALVRQGLSEALGFAEPNHELNRDMVPKQLEHLRRQHGHHPVASVNKKRTKMVSPILLRNMHVRVTWQKKGRARNTTTSVAI